jgi:hypothetical protein
MAKKKYCMESAPPINTPAIRAEKNGALLLEKKHAVHSAFSA